MNKLDCERTPYPQEMWWRFIDWINKIFKRDERGYTLTNGNKNKY